MLYCFDATTQRTSTRACEKLDAVKIDALLLWPTAESKVDILIGKLAKLSEITKTIQYSDATVRTAFAFFGNIPKNYTDLSEPLDTNARIVQHPFFDPEILKKRGGRKRAFRRIKKNKLAGLLAKK